MSSVRSDLYINDYMTAAGDSLSHPEANALQGSAAFTSFLVGREPRNSEQVEEMFARLPALALRQPWPGVSEHFRPGQAKIAHTRDALLVLTEFHDEDVFNPVTGFNQPAYEFGDVAEVFVLPSRRERYVEVHSTPDGEICQFAFRLGQITVLRENPESMKPGEEYAWDPRAAALTWQTATGWSALISVPFSLIGAVPLPSAEWRLAICRYDYTRGQSRPVLSTTANLPKPDFHLTEFWNPLKFV